MMTIGDAPNHVPHATIAPNQAWPLEPVPAPPAAWTDRARTLIPPLVALSLLLGGLAALGRAASRAWELTTAASTRVQICNRFEIAGSRTVCTTGDPFVVVQHGTTNAALQISDGGDAHCVRRPVIITVSETNGTGLVLAQGSTTQVVPCTGRGAVLLPLERVFAQTHLSLPAVSSGSTQWVRDSYTVQVQAGTTNLGAIIFHVAR